MQLHGSSAVPAAGLSASLVLTARRLATMGCCACLVHIYDCLRAWNNPRSICYAPWSKSRLDCHEYYYQEFLKKKATAVCEVAPKGKPCGGGAETSGCTGTIKLTQLSVDACRIEYEIRGLTPGKHGFHIHEKADFSDGCTSAGPHYNPFKKLHGAPEDEERHVGDLGNIEPDANGVAKGVIVDRLIKLEGPQSVVGRSFMVHADPDDLGLGDNSQPGPPPVNGKASRATGNAGARVACGEIKLC